MEPIGQKPPSENPLHSSSSLSFEFLLHLMDLSRKALAGASLSISIPLASLLRTLSIESSLPVVFDFSSSDARSLLENLLTSASSSEARPIINLKILKEESRLLWTFHAGKRPSVTFSSPLILSRPSSIRLESEKIPEEKIFSEEVPEVYLPAGSAALGNAISLGDQVGAKASGRLGGGIASIFSSGPVVAWPSFNPEQTIELIVRWVAQEEQEHTSKIGSSEIAFSLEIPWREKSSESKTVKRVHVSGFFGGGRVTLSGRNLPDDFKAHFRRREDMMSESLKVFPGVALSVRFGESRDNPARGDDPL